MSSKSFQVKIPSSKFDLDDVFRLHVGAVVLTLGSHKDYRDVNGLSIHVHLRFFFFFGFLVAKGSSGSVTTTTCKQKARNCCSVGKERSLGRYLVGEESQENLLCLLMTRNATSFAFGFECRAHIQDVNCRFFRCHCGEKEK